MKRNSQVGGSGHGDVGEQQPGDALAFPHRGGGVVPDAGQVSDELADPVLLGGCEGAVVLLAGFVVGGMGVVEGAQRGVPAGFEGVGDEPVGGVDGEVAAAGQVGVVAGALDVGGASVSSALCSSSAWTVRAASAVSGVRVSMSSCPIARSRPSPGIAAQACLPFSMPSCWHM
jgi:hypothetical protein